ncbi:alpha/beta fold hydrolase [Tunturiibacter gelidoferens]|uniref:alpha/beta fold hydrolase n=1 Tax=Tunturiibacter gelidiferens TaxID=3069689 RepID=UPI0038738265
MRGLRGSLLKAACSRLSSNSLLIGTCVALLLATGSTATTQITNQSKPPVPGTLIDVGGYRVHLYCIGEGSPTVMIVGAAFSFDWGLVQPEVAKWTRVCTFDPSGNAWSDPFQTPTLIPPSQNSNQTPIEKTTPTCTDRVDEIHRLLTKMPIHGPYVLVGFSVGALWERIYAARYPDNIAGMIIVDHAFLPDLGKSAPPHVSPSQGSSHRYSPPVLLSEAPIVMGFEDDSNFSRLPARDQELHMWALSQHPVRPGPEMAADCFALISEVTGERRYPLGDMPLWVINTSNESQDYRALQRKLLALSRTSKQIIAWHSSHMVPIDEPDLITRAIREAVERERRILEKP